MRYLLTLFKLLIWLFILGIIYRHDVADFFISLDFSKMFYVIFFEIFFLILVLFLIEVIFLVLIINLKQFC